MSDIKIKKIFKKQIAIQLIINGHNLICTEPNIKRPNFSVFCFQETDALLADLTNITKK